MELLRSKNDYRKTLRFVSRDKQNKISLIETEDVVFDFDGITKFLCDEFYSKQTLSSCDAFLQRDKEYYLMEFKNQEEQRIRPDEIVKKAFMSFNLLRLEMDQNISVEEARNHTTLFVIFRDDALSHVSANGEKSTCDTREERDLDAIQSGREQEIESSVESISYEAIRNTVGKFAKIEENDPILFGLRKMKGKFYQQIYTIPKSEFMNKWYPQLFSDT